MGTMKNHNTVITDEHDEILNAKRVIIVAGDFDVSKLNQAVTEGLKNIKLDKSEIQTIKVPEIIKEIQILEIPGPSVYIPNIVKVPTIIKETQFQMIEVPKIIENIVIKEIQVPVIIRELEKFPIWFKTCMIITSLSLLGIMLKDLVK